VTLIVDVLEQEPAVPNLPDQQVTRQHVVELLPVLRLTPAQEQKVLAVPYPVDFAVAAAVLESVGIDLDRLTDRMGGSP
jgi:S-adenosylhomocysteine hydrolase